MKALNQTLIPGVLTEADVLKKYFIERGRKGGLAKSAKKAASCRKNIKKAIAARKLKALQRRGAL